MPARPWAPRCSEEGVSIKRKDRAAPAAETEAPTSARQRKKAEKRWPAKRTMNLYVKRKTMFHPTRLVPILLVIALMAAAVGKFGVADRLAAVDAERAELARRQAELTQLQEHIADYDEVKRQYSRYSYTGFDRSLWDRLEVLDLLEAEVFPHCVVRQMSITGRMLTLTVSDLTLGSSSELVGRLEAHKDMVEQVFVSASAFDKVGKEKRDEQIIQMSVLLYSAQEGGKG